MLRNKSLHVTSTFTYSRNTLNRQAPKLSFADNVSEIFKNIFYQDFLRICGNETQNNVIKCDDEYEQSLHKAAERGDSGPLPDFFPRFQEQTKENPQSIRIRKKPVNFKDTLRKEISAMTSVSELDWTQKTNLCIKTCAVY